MSSVNLVILLGYLGADPDERMTKKNEKVVNLRLATSRKINETNDAGEQERVEKTEWHSLACYGNTANFVSNWVKKGDLVAVRGRLSYNSYISPAGDKIFRTNIIVQDLTLISKSKKNQEDECTASSYNATKNGDYDIPF